MGKEFEDSSSKAVIIALNGNEATTYIPVLIKHSEGEIPNFLAEQARQVDTRLAKRERQRNNLTRFRSQNRLRRMTQMHEIREWLESEIRANRDKKDIFDGKKAIPIKIIKERDEIKGFELTSFSEEEQKKWWKFVVSKNLLPEVAGIVQKYPDALPLMTEAFHISTMLGTSLYTEEIEQAKRDLKEFGLRYSRDVNEEQAIDMVPVMKVISQIGRRA